MKHYIYILVVLLLIFCVNQIPLRAAEREEVNTCIWCHAELEDEYLQPALKIPDDIHQKNGISCAGCHGGDATAEDMEIAMSPDNGFIGVPSIREIPQFCARCHSDPVFMRNYNPSLPTDQLDKYWTSHHGILMKEGDAKAAQCVSCHSVHDIRPADDPFSSVYPQNVPQTCGKCHANADYMASYKISTSQYDEFAEGVHGVALLKERDNGAPACNDCHGNHAAMPPGIVSIGRVCFQCHLAEGELFMASPHKDAFEMLEAAECVFCHGNHLIPAPSDEMLGVNEGAVCIECHSEGDEGYLSAQFMRGEIDSLDMKYQQAKGLLENAEQKGVEVSDQLFDLQGVYDGLVNARKLIHAFEREKLKTAADETMLKTREVYQAGIASVNEVKHRRSGFWIYTAVSLLLVLLVILKIRRFK